MSQQISLSDLPKPEEIPGLYTKFKLWPMRGRFEGAWVVDGVVIQKECGCLVTVLARVFNIQSDGVEGYSPGFAAAGINDRQFWSLADGWDDYADRPVGRFYHDCEEWYDYAKACAALTFPHCPNIPGVTGGFNAE